MMVSLDKSVKGYSLPCHSKIMYFKQFQKGGRLDGDVSIYKSMGITKAMTDGSTCGTKAVWTDGWRDERTDRWMEGWRKVDRNDKWAEDECCSLSHTKNTWRSKLLRWQQNLFRDIGSASQHMDGCYSSMVMSIGVDYCTVWGVLLLLMFSGFLVRWRGARTGVLCGGNVNDD